MVFDKTQHISRNVHFFIQSTLVTGSNTFNYRHYFSGGNIDSGFSMQWAMVQNLKVTIYKIQNLILTSLNYKKILYLVTCV